jgi:hypothetical protein
VRHTGTHIAHANHSNRKPGRKGRHDCTKRFDLEMDIKIPNAKPSVTMAVPP